MSDPAIDPGALNRRLVLEAPVETADGAGGVVRSYQAVATLWASVEPVAARGDVVAAQLGATITHRIAVRYSPDITHAASLPRWRAHLPHRHAARAR